MKVGDTVVCIKQRTKKDISVGSICKIHEIFNSNVIILSYDKTLYGFALGGLDEEYDYFKCFIPLKEYRKLKLQKLNDCK